MLTIQECERQVAIFNAKKKALQIVEELKQNEYILSESGFDTFDLLEYIADLSMEINEKVV